MNEVLEVFQRIADNREWNSAETVSGPGSEVANTQPLREQLPEVIKEAASAYLLKSSRRSATPTLLDLGCGDCNWISTLDLSGWKYIGVDAMRVKSRRKVNATTTQYTVADFTDKDFKLPVADAVLLRNVLQHLPIVLSDSLINKVLEMKPQYFMVTSFPDEPDTDDTEIGGFRYNYVDVDVVEAAGYKLDRVIDEVNDFSKQVLYVFKRHAVITAASKSKEGAVADITD